MGNKIPRASKKMEVKFLVPTSAGTDRLSAVKTENGWIGTSSSGERFFLPISMLRNERVCELSKIR